MNTVETLLAAAGVALTTVTVVGGAISAYVVQAVKAATAGLGVSVSSLALSIDLLRKELLHLRQNQDSLARDVAILMDARDRGE